ncbi:hypothetical protein F4556_002912 [Kitasatospora gansuensis]|uniref:Uncharacterized protein n=1 Tax=Kitasatospora gansuensis TaxID=258050 RepID=A0A7W7SC90_9ACTN|nr:hypothetical protein [Kitasatospora gansuensis]MBB4947377.1 hypothetical protein [Kitasatospora gansuensis]
MVQLTAQLARPFRRAAAAVDGAVVLASGGALRVPAVRREMDAAETGELLLSSERPGGPVTFRWQRQGRPAITLASPYRLDRVELKGSHRARLHGLTAGVRLVCPDWSPLFLVSPTQLPVLACAAASSRTA